MITGLEKAPDGSGAVVADPVDVDGSASVGWGGKAPKGRGSSRATDVTSGGAAAPSAPLERAAPEADATRALMTGAPGQLLDAPTPGGSVAPAVAPRDPAASFRVAVVRMAWCGGTNAAGCASGWPVDGKGSRAPDAAALAAARALVALADDADGNELRSLLRPDPGEPATSWTVACYQIGDLVPTAMRDFSDPVAAVRTLVHCGDPDHVAGELVASNATGMHWTALVRTGSDARFQLFGASWSEEPVRGSPRTRGLDRSDRGHEELGAAPTDLLELEGDDPGAGKMVAGRAQELGAAQRRWAQRLAGWSVDQAVRATWGIAPERPLPGLWTGARRWDLAVAWRRTAQAGDSRADDVGSLAALHEPDERAFSSVDELVETVRDLVAEVRDLRRATDALALQLGSIERPHHAVDKPADLLAGKEWKDLADRASVPRRRRRVASVWPSGARDRQWIDGDAARDRRDVRP